jgi:hypothetical protein
MKISKSFIFPSMCVILFVIFGVIPFIQKELSFDQNINNAQMSYNSDIERGEIRFASEELINLNNVQLDSLILTNSEFTDTGYTGESYLSGDSYFYTPIIYKRTNSEYSILFSYEDYSIWNKMGYLGEGIHSDVHLYVSGFDNSSLKKKTKSIRIHGDKLGKEKKGVGIEFISTTDKTYGDNSIAIELFWQEFYQEKPSQYIISKDKHNLYTLKQEYVGELRYDSMIGADNDWIGFLARKSIDDLEMKFTSQEDLIKAINSLDPYLESNKIMQSLLQ